MFLIENESRTLGVSMPVYSLKKAVCLSAALSGVWSAASLSDNYIPPGGIDSLVKCVS